MPNISCIPTNKFVSTEVTIYVCRSHLDQGGITFMSF